MSIMDYCEYNALRAWRKRSSSAAVRAEWVDAAQTMPQAHAATLVEEHGADSTTGVHVRAIHEAMLRREEL